MEFATRTRDDVRRVFVDRHSDYRKFASVALANQPQLLEQMVLAVRV